VIKEIMRLLKPGGYVEVRDVDPEMKNEGDNRQIFFGGCKHHHQFSLFY
jgi:hypothetical protein